MGRCALQQAGSQNSEIAVNCSVYNFGFTTRDSFNYSLDACLLAPKRTTINWMFWIRTPRKPAVEANYARWTTAGAIWKQPKPFSAWFLMEHIFVAHQLWRVHMWISLDLAGSWVQLFFVWDSHLFRRTLGVADKHVHSPELRPYTHILCLYTEKGMQSILMKMS